MPSKVLPANLLVNSFPYLSKFQPLLKSAVAEQIFTLSPPLPSNGATSTGAAVGYELRPFSLEFAELPRPQTLVFTSSSSQPLLVPGESNASLGRTLVAVPPPLPDGASALEKNGGNLANFLQVAGAVVVGLAFVHELWQYVRGVRADSVSKDLLRFPLDGRKIVFIPDQKLRLRDVVANLLEWRLVHEALQRTTPEFPHVYLSPRRFLKVQMGLRQDLQPESQGDRGLEVGQNTSEAHMEFVFSRRSVVADVPELQRDRLSAGAAIRLLSDPLHYYRLHQLRLDIFDPMDLRPATERGEGRRVILMHLLEGLGLMTLFSTDAAFRARHGFNGRDSEWDVLGMALSEVQPELVPGSAPYQQKYETLKRNGLSLLRLIALPSDRTMEILEKCAPAGAKAATRFLRGKVPNLTLEAAGEILKSCSVDGPSAAAKALARLSGKSEAVARVLLERCLDKQAQAAMRALAQQIPSLEAAKEQVEERMRPKGLWTRFIGPALTWIACLGRNNRRWSTDLRPSAHQIGIYPFFSTLLHVDVVDSQRPEKSPRERVLT